MKNDKSFFYVFNFAITKSKRLMMTSFYFQYKNTSRSIYTQLRRIIFKLNYFGILLTYSVISKGHSVENRLEFLCHQDTSIHRLVQRVYWQCIQSIPLRSFAVRNFHFFLLLRLHRTQGKKPSNCSRESQSVSWT